MEARPRREILALASVAVATVSDPDTRTPGGGLTNVGPFINLQNDVYWGGTPHIGQNLAYIFEVVYGRNLANFVGNSFYATALSVGAIGAAVVPLPASLWLLGTGVAAVVARRRRRAS